MHFTILPKILAGVNRQLNSLRSENILTLVKKQNLLVSGQRSGEPLSNLSNAKRLDSKSKSKKKIMFVYLKKLPFDSLVPSNSGSLVLVEEEFSVFVF